MMSVSRRHQNISVSASNCNHSNSNNNMCNKSLPVVLQLMDQTRKLVCVTSGSSYLGAHLIKELLTHQQHGTFLVRATVQNPADIEEMERLIGSEEMKMMESIVVAKLIGSSEALCDAFTGCHLVFHTSSFLDPHGLSGYNETSAFLEAEGARNVIEACGRSAYVKRCIFTSSLLSSIWINNVNDDTSVVDETCWSDEDFCRDNRLWLALGKTRAEKVAWNKAKEMKVKLITICPALVMAPSFPDADSKISLPYLKGGRLMLERGLLATEDVVSLAKAHVQLYQAMDDGAASGRYICFDRTVDTHEDAARLENGLKIHGLLTGGDNIQPNQTNNNNNIPTARISNARIKRLLAQAQGRPSCKLSCPQT